MVRITQNRPPVVTIRTMSHRPPTVQTTELVGLDNFIGNIIIWAHIALDNIRQE
jgi:hypothetical protein